MGTELAERVEGASLTVAEIRANAALIQQVMQAVMKKGTHYGVIPGAGDKPTLFKAGSEKILSTFRIAVNPEVVDLSTPDEIRYRVVARGTHQSSGIFLGSGVGEASSNEEKYKWRYAACEAEYRTTPEDRRRLKYKRDGSTIKQVRTNPPDIANTVLKTAKKRAQVDLTLTVTAASDCFAQDLEDLEDGVRDAVVGDGHAAKTPIAEPRRKSEKSEKPDLPEGSVIFKPEVVEERVSPKSGKHYFVVKLPSGEFANFFDKNHYALIIEARDAGKEIEAKLEIQGKFNNLTDVVMISQV